MSLQKRQERIAEYRHLTLYGSWTFNTIGLEECARFVVQRQVPLKELITHRFRLDQAGEAFA